MSSLELAALYNSFLEDMDFRDEELCKPLSDILLEKVSSSLYFDLKRVAAYLGLKHDVVEDIERENP